jgi:hypothetical protein
MITYLAGERIKITLVIGRDPKLKTDTFTDLPEACDESGMEPCMQT